MAFKRKRQCPAYWKVPGFLVVFGALIVFVGLAAVSPVSAEVPLFKGQTVYAPAYSHIYYGDREQPFLLAVTLSIRNTDPRHAISLVAVDYYDTDGKLLTHHLEKPLMIGPMASTRYVVKESDRTGGSGANFVVKWKAEAKVTAPLIETIMISTATQQGLSFTSRGVVTEEVRD